MKWNKIERTYARTTIPLDRMVLVIYRGNIGLCCWSNEDKCFWIAWDPSSYDTMRISSDNEYKLQFWCDIEKLEGY